MTTSAKFKRTIRKTKKRFTAWIPVDVLKLLKNEANDRRTSQQSILESALRERYIPADTEGEIALVLRRITKVDSKLKTLDRELEIIAETIALFIRTWLAYTDEVPESRREETQFKGQRRFEKFLINLSKRITVGQSLFSDLPDEAASIESCNT